MVRNYFTVAVRNLLRHKVYSLINVAGLAIGMACCAVILLHVNGESSYDGFHQDADRVYRLAVRKTSPKEIRVDANPPLPLVRSLLDQYPEVAHATMIFRHARVLVEIGGRKAYEGARLATDPGFLEVFTFPVIRGAAEHPLRDRNSVVITESLAREYFGNDDPIGQTVTIDNRDEHVITAVVADPPRNSHLEFKLVTLFDPSKYMWMDNWNVSTSLSGYLKLAEGSSSTQLEEGIDRYIKAHKVKIRGRELAPVLQPLMSIHLDPSVEGGFHAPGSPENLIILATLAAFVLLIACINTINLSTARSAYRGREVGVRKTLGAGRSQLVRQFLGESLLLSGISAVVALVLVDIAIPHVSTLLGTQIGLAPGVRWMLPLLLLGASTLTGLLSGFYPAVLLAREQAAEAAKAGKALAGSGRVGLNLRRGLIFVQFGLSALLIVGTIVVSKQLQFVQTTDLGFSREADIVLPIFGWGSGPRYRTIRQEIGAHPGVTSVTACNQTFVSHQLNSSARLPDSEDRSEFTTELYNVDERFVDHFGVRLLAGENRLTLLGESGGLFSFVKSGEEANVLINQTLMRAMGYTAPDDALGRELILGLNGIRATVVGVVADFHIQSLHEPIEPVVILSMPDQFQRAVVRVQPGATRGVLEHLEAVWSKFEPDHPFEYAFLEEKLGKAYEAEVQTRRIVLGASILAISIACIGLLGLAAYAAERRTKEVGIRKTLGATIGGIVAMMVREYAVLIVLGNVVAWPIAYVLMSRWLESFAYRTVIGPWVFIGTGLVTLSFALLTAGSQAMRAAWANPVEALRYE